MIVLANEQEISPLFKSRGAELLCGADCVYSAQFHDFLPAACAVVHV